MTGDRALLRNFVEKFMGTVRFGNDNFAAITGYDFVWRFRNAFRSKTCYVRNLEGDDLLTGGRDSNLYTISISGMAASSPICLMFKATLTNSCLWHRHLNFGTINDLTKLALVDGLPKFKYEKDHLCSAYERGKKQESFSSTEIDSKFTWVYFLHLKDETLEIIKKFIAQAQLNYKAKFCKIQTDNDTEFKNATLKAYYENLGIINNFHCFGTPHQNELKQLLQHQKSSDTTINSAAQPAHDQEDSPSTSLIIVDTHEAPHVVTTSDEQNSLIALQESDEFNQEASADFDVIPIQPSTHSWTKDHPLDQVIGDPSKPVMTRQRLHIDSKVCMYALTISTIEPKKHQKLCVDHSLYLSLSDGLNQFERLQVWELVPRPEGKNVIALKWLWKNKEM
ncbi:retrovirus-related pol polyprotein from transposon TNT 1-94 [Tanacetum coccineum]|uniref:Retrovirus-related pol polyprotein from transposon TNT 1-94 n=1 Tax=Tanacetum coccineum TaxID=301880 RepID=A0ABQ5IYI6_9ASTR